MLGMLKRLSTTRDETIGAAAHPTSVYGNSAIIALAATTTSHMFAMLCLKRVGATRNTSKQQTFLLI
jgi:hypothetical protein